MTDPSASPAPASVYSHRLGPQDARDLGREVLLTDGLGSFALSSPAGVPTRSFSGLAQDLNTLPAVQPQNMFIAPLEVLEVAGRPHTLHAFEVAPGTVEGDGLDLLSHVDLNDLLPTRVQLAGGVRVARTSFVPQRSGALVYLYQIEAPEDVTLTLGALLTHRGARQVCAQAPELEFLRAGAEVTVSGVGNRAHLIGLRLHTAEGDLRAAGTEHPGTEGLRPESLRPQPGSQRLHFRLGSPQGHTDRAVSTPLWRLKLSAGSHRLALVVGDVQKVPDPWAAHVEDVRRRRALILQTFAACGVQDSVTATLALSADSFLVWQNPPGAEALRSGPASVLGVISGYPFSAAEHRQHRGSMIALTGLTLVTGRLDEARALLDTPLRALQRRLTPDASVAPVRAVSQEDGSGPEGPAPIGAPVEADPLWLMVALERYLRASGDGAFAAAHLESLRGLLREHLEGGHHGSRADPADGLLLVGPPGAARRGKPVELQALWLAALAAESRLSLALEQEPQYRAALARARAAFLQFWNPESGALYDALSPTGTPESRLSPAALLALALPDTPAVPEQLASALLAAGRELLTPLGLRTLAPGRPDLLHGAHTDLNAAHPNTAQEHTVRQNTVQPWPLGAYVELLLRQGQITRARIALDGLIAHLWEAGLGSVSEDFGGDPLTPGRCAFQAAGVAELLRSHVLVCHAEAAQTEAARAEVARAEVAQAAVQAEPV